LREAGETKGGEEIAKPLNEALKSRRLRTPTRQPRLPRKVLAWHQARGRRGRSSTTALGKKLKGAKLVPMYTIAAGRKLTSKITFLKW
jgi:hypothetical protein